MVKKKILLGVALSAMCATSAYSADWPVLGGNFKHNYKSDEVINFPMKQIWKRQGPLPDPAFLGLLANPGDNETFTEDMIDYPIAGEGRIFVPSAREQTITCLDATTGDELWIHFTEGPVRVSPTLYKGILMVVSDDGIIKGLDAVSGAEKWRIDKPPYPRRAVGNERLNSAWPIRSGITVIDGVAYGARGCFSPHGAFVYAFNPITGKIQWEKETMYSPQGRMIIQDERLIVGTGRTSPFEVSLKDGKEFLEIVRRRGFGSTWVSEIAGFLCYGRSENGTILIRRPIERTNLGREFGLNGKFTGIEANKISEGFGNIYALESRGLVAYDRDGFIKLLSSLEDVAKSLTGLDKNQLRVLKKAKNYGRTSGGSALLEDMRLRFGLAPLEKWIATTGISSSQKEFPTTTKKKGKKKKARGKNAIKIYNGWESILVTVDTVIVGGKDKISAFDSKSGKETWTQAVKGTIMELAISDGVLLASSKTGQIYAFADARKRHQLISKMKEVKSLTVSSNIQSQAKLAIEQADIQKGWCAILGGTPNSAELAIAISKQSEFYIVIVEKDKKKANDMRLSLRKMGLYGDKIVVHHSQDSSLVYPHGFANLVIGNDSWDAKKVLRIVQPYGGALIMPKSFSPNQEWKPANFAKWKSIDNMKVAIRGESKGAGEWSHFHANPAGTANSNDDIITDKVGMQWWGRPGPENVVDRHALAMPPLFKAGKLVITGKNDNLTCLDAYNGTVLWKVDTPGLMRHWISHNAGCVAINDEYAFAACKSECRMIDINTGETVKSFKTPDAGKHWGSVMIVDDYLIGTVQETKASDDSRNYRSGLIDARKNISNVVVGKKLFVINVKTGKTIWTKEDKTWLHPTLIVAEGNLFVAESTSSKISTSSAGVANLSEFFANNQGRLVSYDLKTGNENWNKPLKQLSDEYEHIMFLMADDGVLLSVRTGFVTEKKLIGYLFEAYDLKTGKPIWNKTTMSDKKKYSPLAYGKNMQAAHPTIANGKIYWLAHVFATVFCYDLQTGEDTSNTAFGNGWTNKGCAPPTSSNTALYFRHTYTVQYPFKTKKQEPLLMIGRPSCWMSIISGGGLLLNPEAGSGCTCGLPMSISTGMSPRDW